jgi:hypothetical protein
MQEQILLPDQDLQEKLRVIKTEIQVNLNNPTQQTQHRKPNIENLTQKTQHRKPNTENPTQQTQHSKPNAANPTLDKITSKSVIPLKGTLPQNNFILNFGHIGHINS